jgi:hypothetical protein
LIDSVVLRVKMISAGWAAPMKRAMRARAASYSAVASSAN